MCTISETKVTTTIIIAVRLSIRKPTSNFRLPMTAQLYSVPLKRLPASTSLRTTKEATREMQTPRIAIQWVSVRPMLRPKNPAMMAPTSGANGTSR